MTDNIERKPRKRKRKMFTEKNTNFKIKTKPKSILKSKQ